MAGWGRAVWRREEVEELLRGFEKLNRRKPRFVLKGKASATPVMLSDRRAGIVEIHMNDFHATVIAVIDGEFYRYVIQ